MKKNRGMEKTKKNLCGEDIMEGRRNEGNFE